MTLPLVSVVIPNLHSPVIGLVLDALRQQTVLPHEVIVVGQDRHRQVRNDAFVRFVETPRPVPAAVARNTGARVAQGAIILFLDADCVAAPDLVALHANAHLRGERVVGGAVAPANNGFWARCDHLSSYTLFLPEAPAGERPYLLSGNLSIHTGLFAQIGGFDENFSGAAGEDVEFGLRLRHAGVQLTFCPTARVAHHSPRLTLRSSWRHLALYGAVTAKINRMQAGPLPASPGYTMASRLPWLLLLLAPLVGPLKLASTVGAYPFLWRYWPLFPGIALQQSAWCWGMAVALARYASTQTGAASSASHVEQSDT